MTHEFGQRIQAPFDALTITCCLYVCRLLVSVITWKKPFNVKELWSVWNCTLEDNTFCHSCWFKLQVFFKSLNIVDWCWQEISLRSSSPVSQLTSYHFMDSGEIFESLVTLWSFSDRIPPSGSKPRYSKISTRHLFQMDSPAQFDLRKKSQKHNAVHKIKWFFWNLLIFASFVTRCFIFVSNH